MQISGQWSHPGFTNPPKIDQLYSTSHRGFVKNDLTMSTDRPGILFQESVLAQNIQNTFRDYDVPNGRPPSKQKGWPKLPQVLQGASGGWEDRRFLATEPRILRYQSCLKHFEWGKSSEIQTSFYFVGIYTPTPLENNRLQEPQNDGLKAHLSLQGQPTTCALPTFCCLLQTLFYQLKLSKQPNLSKFIFALAQGLHGSIRAQHRTIIKIMDDQSLTCRRLVCAGLWAYSSMMIRDMAQTWNPGIRRIIKT